MGNTEFVRSVVKEIIEPGVERLMNGAFFSELRRGTAFAPAAAGLGAATALPQRGALQGLCPADGQVRP